MNRFNLEGGNPYLKPEKIHDLQLSGIWSNFFGQLSYSYKKDPILDTTVPYGDAGEVRLITKENFPKIQQLQAFVGSQFRIGIWQPKVNASIIKQWLNIDVNGQRKSHHNPIGLIQWQIAIHIPADVWLNVDLQWMSAGNSANVKNSSTSFINVKLYKAFFHNSFSVSVEANDIFNKNISKSTLFSKDVTIFKSSGNISRRFQLTLQYSFNTTRNRYKGKGAGNNEMDRF